MLVHQFLWILMSYLMQLQGAEHSIYLDLLRMFAHGTWSEYKSRFLSVISPFLFVISLFIILHDMACIIDIKLLHPLAFELKDDLSCISCTKHFLVIILFFLS